jgi:hypothetical protein
MAQLGWNESSGDTCASTRTAQLDDRRRKSCYKHASSGQPKGTERHLRYWRPNSFEGKAVWEGVVHVFDPHRPSDRTRAYAWSSPIEGSTKRRFFAVLHTDRINSPLEAVRVAIVAERRTTRWIYAGDFGGLE